MGRPLGFDILANPAGWNRGFDAAAKRGKQFSRDLDGAGKSTKAFSEHTSRAGSTLKAVFATFSAGVVVAGLKKTVDAASAMNETASKTKVVFGPAAKQVEDFSRRAATSMGLSRQEAQESAATFGNLFVSMKIGAPKAADMSTKMVQLAGDLASFNNANPTETLEALRSGLVGETEPLRRFGINLNDADLRQKALALGLVKTTKEVLPPAVKAQAAYALILEQSKTAQGDFARTSGGLANQQRILAAKIKDLQANIGQALLPAVLKGVSAFNAFLGAVDRNRKAFGILAGILGTAAAAIGGLLLVERTVKATQEAIRVATIGWATAQKGLNVVLGVTAVQAKTTAEAESGLAASTAAASTASAGMRASLLTAVPVVGALAIGFGVSRDAIKDNVSTFDELRSKLGFHVKKIDDARAATAAAAQAHVKLAADAAAAGVAESDLAGKTAEQAQAAVKAAASINDLSAKLKDARGELAKNRESMAQTITSYDGLISKSKVTAAEVVGDLRNQVANFKTYAADTQRLLRAGVNPAAIRELSEKGPQFIHALATGSDRRLREYKAAWAARQAEVRTSFAASIDAQYAKLVKQIKAMQRQIDSLRGKDIPITASLKLNFSKSFTQQDWAQVKVATRGATGGLVVGPGGPTSDRVPALLSSGEFVVNAAAVRQVGVENMKRLNAMRFAIGGPVGTIDREARDVNRLQAKGTGIRMDRGLERIMRAFSPGGARDVSSVARWTAAILGRAAEWAAWARRIMFESGGNWSAVNRTDSNWLAGHPSVGGAQVIRGTFAAYAGRYRGLGPYLYGVSVNPWANSYAGGNYAIHRYGSLMAVDPLVRPRGYDAGGYLPPGLSLAYNGTGRPEPVGGRATPTLKLEIRSGGSKLDDLLVQVLSKAIRGRGGNVQAVLGS